MKNITQNKKPKVVIAGATGFIGRWFIDQFRHKYDFIALSRSAFDNSTHQEGVEWRVADLYSLTSSNDAVKGADYAIYLVHSMMPSTRLNQSSFEDTDLILADNFARACEAQGVKQILYVGGILPEDKNLSAHLRSRYEVELTLGSRKTPLTAIRAGLVIGPGGSSFNIIEKLVQRLPVMGCPKWTRSKTQSVALKDILLILDYCLGNEKAMNEAIEVGGHKVMTYQEMLRKTSEVMDKKRYFFRLPFFTLGLSKLWVSLFSDSNISLISPLVESLKHSMVAKSHPLVKEMGIDFMPFEEAVKFAIEKKHLIPPLPKKLHIPKSEEKEKNTVRSVQRLANPRRESATWVARRYTHWLPGFFRSFIRVRTDAHENCSFHIWKLSKPILKLTFMKERSKDGRQLFYITGGLLDKRADYGWLEFREVLDRKFVMTAIHEFVPALPWYLYVSTQAVVHLWVMNNFNRYLKGLGEEKERSARSNTSLSGASS